MIGDGTSNQEQYTDIEQAALAKTCTTLFAKRLLKEKITLYILLKISLIYYPYIKTEFLVFKIQVVQTFWTNIKCNPIPIKKGEKKIRI